ncbi:unnamed protein product [Rotaria sp. Silwood1]|nr:unnamed protein product [Rotaria sp. Silwood1]CAF1652682.1 unnamed protein product [Rotaria sp. Silwood1]CAF3777518.1 unnamed protein product [Rotaria sp. Silwood1]CAF3792005.1 unnamed protein product [Rotaria sp. Silwood1]CAF3841261.1 unnamed protein product [Rotaria sp. Silwood1]
MARNSVVNIDDLLADERLHKLFQQLNITEDNKKKLCEAFQHYFMTSTSTDICLNKIKQELIKLSKIVNQDDLKNIVGKISEFLEEHSHVFSETLNRIRILENKTGLLYDQIMELKERSNMKEAFILANDLSTLYEEYFVKPVFLRRFGDGSWDKFIVRLNKFEEETNKNILKSIQGRSSVKYEDLYAPLIKYLEPLQKEIDLSLTDIQFLRQDRCAVTHYKTDTMDDQLDLLKKAKTFDFSSNFEHKELVHKMIKALDNYMANFPGYA